MYDTLLNTIDQLDMIQLESQLSIYDAMGEQLIKEYFMRESGVFQEATNPSKQKKDGILNDKGSVPTITKIADWFGRMITKIRAYFARKHTSRMLDKIKNSPRFTDNEQLDVILVRPDWYKKNVYDNTVTLLDCSSQWVAKENQEQTNVLKYPSQFKKVMHNVNTLRGALQDIYEDIKPLAAVNDILTRRVVKKYDASYMMEPDTPNFANNVSTLLAIIDECNEMMKQCFDVAFKSIKQVKQEAKKLNGRETLHQAQEQYVKFITDLTRSYLLIAQIQVRILDWIWATMGADHNKNNDDEEE